PEQKAHKLPPAPKPGYYLVALIKTSNAEPFKDPEGVVHNPDYHWYRQNPDGTWSNKHGQMPAEPLLADPTTGFLSHDPSTGIPVRNPESDIARHTDGIASYDPRDGEYHVLDYDQFCGYMYIKQGGINVGEPMVGDFGGGPGGLT